MSITNFPNGVSSFGVPQIGDGVPAFTGNVFWVDSNSLVAASGNPGTFEYPLTSIDTAIGLCSAGNGDVIIAKEGHTETISAAGGITADIAGVTIVGLGSGNNRPVITFSNTASTFLVTANNVKVSNIIGVPSVDSVVNALVVSGDNCVIDLEWQDDSAAIEAVTAIRLDTANNVKVKLKYLGFATGDAAVRCIAVDDCDHVNIDIDAYGVVSTAWVNLVDVASTNVFVSGKLYTEGVVDGSRNIVDTIGGSSFFSDIVDISAGTSVSKGSGAFFVPGLGYRVTKTEDVNVATGDDLFTVTGKVLLTLLTGEVTNAIGAATNDYKLRIKTDNIDLCAAGDISTDAIGTLYSLTGDATDTLVTAAEGIKAVDHSDSGRANRIVGLAGGSCVIQSNRTAGDAGDAINWTLFYLPLELGASVVTAS